MPIIVTADTLEKSSNVLEKKIIAWMNSLRYWVETKIGYYCRAVKGYCLFE